MPVDAPRAQTNGQRTVSRARIADIAQDNFVAPLGFGSSQFEYHRLPRHPGSPARIRAARRARGRIHSGDRKVKAAGKIDGNLFAGLQIAHGVKDDGHRTALSGARIFQRRADYIDGTGHHMRASPYLAEGHGRGYPRTQAIANAQPVQIDAQPVRGAQRRFEIGHD